MKNDPKIKLTLSVKKSIIEKAKLYATQNGTSVSNMVEDYLSEYVKVNKEAKTEFRNSLAFEMMGFAQNPSGDASYGELKDQYLKEKYGL